MATTEPVTRDQIGLRSERGPILLSLMMATFLIAIDATILATAVPSVVDDLGGARSFPWLFSVYLLAQAVSVPLYSKVADTVGRKPVLLFGIGLFLVASIACGFAPSLLGLIIFRAVQGIGAGAILPISITIAGDIYSVAERAKVQGYLASMWALSSVVGPTLGGVFSEYVSWRWIFFVNVPLCLIALWLLARNYREDIARTDHRIDYAGAATLTVGLVLLLLGLLEGGQAWAWGSTTGIGCFVGATVLLVAFALIEQRASEPVLPLWVFSRRLLLTTALISTGVGAMMTGLTSYVPNFLERSGGAGALVAGLSLAALMVGWPLSASNAGRVYLRVGYRPTALVGSAIATGGGVILATTSHATSVGLTALSCFVVGLGLGLVATPTLIAAQASVEWEDRAVVTGANMFSRSIGSAVGVAAFGAIANARLDDLGTGANGVAIASRAVFWAVVAAGLATLIAATAMPRTQSDASPTGDGDPV